MREPDTGPANGLVSIGEVRESTGLTERRIRYYEAQGLISPQRTRGNQRLYSQTDMQQLLKIKEWLDAGTSLREIRQRLSQPDVSHRGYDTSEIERDAEQYFQSKRIARGEQPPGASLYPLHNRATLLRRFHRSDDESEKER